MKQVNIGIVGVGNCASSMIQGVEYYTRARGTTGLTNPICAGYTLADLRLASAFDVDSTKVGRDLSEAIWLQPNNALKFADVPYLGVRVMEGLLADGLGQASAARINAVGNQSVQAVSDHLRDTETDVVVNFLPTGSQRASELYAGAALQARCGFVNCMPAVLARSPEWAGRFEQAGLPLVGDDLRSQFGSTLIHHALVDALSRNGVDLSHTYQIVSGGNMDFLNLSDPQRGVSKNVTKTVGFGGATFSPGSAHFGVEYVPFLHDRKLAFIRVEGQGFGGTSVEVEVRMAVEDSPSAAGNVLDAVRLARRAMHPANVDLCRAASALLMKAPLQALPEAVARAIIAQQVM